MKVGSCAACVHGTFSATELFAYGTRAVGTCELGGPNPGDGCSDVGAAETCPKYEARLKEIKKVPQQRRCP